MHCVCAQPQNTTIVLYDFQDLEVSDMKSLSEGSKLSQVTPIRLRVCEHIAPFSKSNPSSRDTHSPSSLTLSDTSSTARWPLHQNTNQARYTIQCIVRITYTRSQRYSKIIGPPVLEWNTVLVFTQSETD